MDDNDSPTARSGAFQFDLAPSLLWQLEVLVRGSGHQAQGLVVGSYVSLPDPVVSIKYLEILEPGPVPTAGVRSRYPHNAVPGLIGYFRTENIPDPQPRLGDDEALSALFGTADSWLVLAAPDHSTRDADIRVSFYLRHGDGTLQHIHELLAAALLRGTAAQSKPAPVWRNRILWIAPTAAVLFVLLHFLSQPNRVNHHNKDRAIQKTVSPPVVKARPRDTAAGDSLKLEVDSTGNPLIVTWDPASLAVQHATQAFLVAFDPSGRRQVPLTRAQLLSGSFRYSSAQLSLTLILLLYEDTDKVVTASRIVLRDSVKEMATLRPAPSIAAAAPSESPTAPERPEQPVASVEPSDVAPAQAPLPRREEPHAQAPPSVAVIAPPPQPRPEPPRLPEQPLVPQPTSPRSVTYSSLVPVKRVNPLVPPGVRSLLGSTGTVSVKVKVEVDAAGNVTNAYPVNEVSGNSASVKLLEPHAVQAAMLWHFTPALRDGVPVASETILQFQFSK